MGYDGGVTIDAAVSERIEIRSLVILANPAAGSFRASVIDEIEARLRVRGVDVETILTRSQGDIRRIAETTWHSCDAIAVCGGDGTIGEAVAGLHAREGAKPALIAIPGGTANVLAHELGLPRKADEIADMIAAGRTRPLHYGLANGRAFFLMVSAGLDAAAVHKVSPELKRRTGKFAFIVAAFAALRDARTPDVVVESDRGTMSARIAIVANAACYGGPHLIARETATDRPGLSLVLAKRDDFASLLRIGWSMLFHTKDAGPLIAETPILKARLTAGRPVPVQVDGDAFGTTPVAIEAVAEPLRIVVAR
ncbi:MAG: diacylglycerol kinase family protein [Beijerinckiaceae bacterium]